MGVLTGDFVFVGDVGRPDLLEKAAGVANTMEAGARVLYHSIEAFRDLPDHVQILPGHGAGSACGKALGSVPSSTLGYEKLVNWAFQVEGEDDFVGQVLADQPEPPVYFAQMKQMNRDGPPVLEALPEPQRMDPTALADLLQKALVVVDTRDFAAFAAGHVPGTLSIPLRYDFPNWCGWYLPYDQPIYLIVDSEADAKQAARDLAFIGIDNSEGYFDAEALEVWARDQGPLETTAETDWAAADRAVAEEGATLLDVRRLTEWNEGHVPGARHVHLGYLRGRADELPRDRPVALYCRTGKRSAIGASILQAEGFGDVRNIRGGTEERVKQGGVLEAD